MKKTSTEMEIKISNARITNVNTRILPNGSCKLELEMDMTTQKQNNNEIVNDECILVEASMLSLNDDFMNVVPITYHVREFKAILTKVITNGIEDFYRPTMDPSFADNEKTKIHYKAGDLPAVGKSYGWWEETVKNSKWCIGTKSQYIAFLGVLIKNLVAKGWTIDDAWWAVCEDSKKLGHFWNSGHIDHKIEDTGSRKICGFFDLANTYKMLAKDEETGRFWATGACGRFDSNAFPLANLVQYDNYFEDHNYGVAWLVCKKEI